MRKAIILLVLFLVLLVAPTGLRYWQFYGVGGGEERPSVPEFDPASIQAVPTPLSAEFVDAPEMGDGLVLLDEAHRNQFDLDDISYLDGRLAARGYELLSFTNGDLAAALRPVSAFVVIAPLDTFDTAELQAIDNFVARGGHLLLVGDPTRYNIDFEETDFDFIVTFETDRIPLNSVANGFDIIYNGDYLYNTIENEGNFRNIILADFAEDRLTDGLEQVAFYGSHSLQLGSEVEPLLMANDDTWSSATDRPGGLTVAALGGDGRVLALGDIQFMTEPYHTVFDNGRFIAQIADFLTEEEPVRREFELSDFPYFYDHPVDLVYTGNPELGPDAFDEIIDLQNAFRDVGQKLSLTAVADDDHDTLYLGLYNQSADVAEILASAGISLTIDPPVLTEAELRLLEDEADPDEEPTAEEELDEEEIDSTQLIQSQFGNVQMSGTALILLDESNDQRRVVVLAASKDGLENAIGRLLNNIPLDADFSYADCLMEPTFALCPSNVADEEVEAELLTGGTPVTEEGEPAEDPDEEGDTGDETDDSGDESDLGGFEDTIEQGFVALGETVEAEIGEDERHIWLFADGPAVIDLVAEGSDLDLVMEIYNPQGQLLESVDSGFAGDGESFFGLEVEEGEYSILLRDFFGAPGAYSLTVTESEGDGDDVGSAGGDGRVFVFADNDGQPLASGFTSFDAFTTLLSDNYEVTTWIATEDGPLDLDTLLEHDLVIWDSGDYQDLDGFFGEDTAVIIEYIDAGGSLFITGLAPTFLGGLDESNLSSISDVEIVGDNPALLDNLTAGDIIELDDTYEGVISDLFASDDEEGLTAFFLRGPDSGESGGLAGAAIIEEEFDDRKTILLLFPFISLPEDVQEILLTNLMNWYGLG